MKRPSELFYRLFFVFAFGGRSRGICIMFSRKIPGAKSSLIDSVPKWGVFLQTLTCPMYLTQKWIWFLIHQWLCILQTWLIVGFFLRSISLILLLQFFLSCDISSILIYIVLFPPVTRYCPLLYVSGNIFDYIMKSFIPWIANVL